MRDYSRVASSFWTGDTGRALRSDPNCQLVALYLVTSPLANMIGLYHCPPAFISIHTGLSIADVSAALAKLGTMGFCRYDLAREEVWIVNMAHFQTHDDDGPNERQARTAARIWRQTKRSTFHNAFFDRYKDEFGLNGPVQNGPIRDENKAQSVSFDPFCPDFGPSLQGKEEAIATQEKAQAKAGPAGVTVAIGPFPEVKLKASPRRETVPLTDPRFAELGITVSTNRHTGKTEMIAPSDPAKRSAALSFLSSIAIDRVNPIAPALPVAKITPESIRVDPLRATIEESSTESIERPPVAVTMVSPGNPDYAHSPAFDQFWAEYPRKEKKSVARAKWVIVMRTAPSASATRDAIMVGLERWKRTEQWNSEGGRFIPHASSFLNQRRWEDDIPAPRPPQGNIMPTAADSGGPSVQVNHGTLAEDLVESGYLFYPSIQRWLHRNKRHQQLNAQGAGMPDRFFPVAGEQGIDHVRLFREYNR